MTASKKNTYFLNDHDNIVSVDGSWDKFAKDNGGESVQSGDICGSSIWSFIKGDATRMWLEVIFQYVRLHGTSVERLYRCDSPELKRYMRMRIVPEENGTLRVEHEILDTEERAVPVYMQYGTTASKNTRQRCSICGRVNIDGWKELTDKEAEALGNILVTYTVCEDCKQLMPGL